MSDMDDQPPTAWEEINPPMTVPAATSARPFQSLAHRSPWNDPQLALKPASRDDFRNHLTACLSLVAPSGMVEGERRDWLLAAWSTLEGIPTDLLERGCKAARRTADHPAKIVPAIIAEIEEGWKWRRQAFAQSTTPPNVPEERRIERPLSAAEIVETNELLAKVGAVTRFRDDGSRFNVETPAQKAEARGPLRNPTRQDYIEMGVDPAVLDEIERSKAA